VNADEETRLRHDVKARLRQQARAIRGQLPAGARAKRSNAITDRVLALDAFSEAQAVAMFVTIRSEVDTSHLLRGAWAAGTRVALPRIDFDNDRLVLHWVDADAELTPNRYGIPEPSASLAPVSAEKLGCILVPGLAADDRGHRIGYGRGFYDRLLPEQPRATRVFIGYDFQLVAEVPDTEGDEPVDWVITDARTIRCPARS